jgi:hypothetical protein
MTLRTRHDWLYFINATVLLIHQVEAAYWHEWRLFHLPDSLTLFLLMNIPIVALVLYGVRALAENRAVGLKISWALVAAGLFAAIFHGVYLWQGDQAFTLAISSTLLAATALLSLAQCFCLLQLSKTRAMT